MTQIGAQSRLSWRGKTPVSTRFDDPYYSLENGLFETEYVYLAGNNLPNRFFPGFRIAELGFGTGLGAITAWRAWKKNGLTGALSFVSFEIDPLSPKELSEALSAFSEIEAESEALIAQYRKNLRHISLSGLELHIITGDARETLPKWEERSDAWFLDGFSPSKNPELWEEGLLFEVGKHSNPGATAATYSAAGHVRAKLSNAGFYVERRKGFGRKRHMISASLAAPVKAN